MGFISFGAFLSMRLNIDTFFFNFEKPLFSVYADKPQRNDKASNFQLSDIECTEESKNIRTFEDVECTIY